MEWSWNGHCAGAGLQCNKGAAWGPKCWKQVLSVEPSDAFQEVSAAVVKETERGKLQTSTEKFKQFERQHPLFYKSILQVRYESIVTFEIICLL